MKKSQEEVSGWLVTSLLGLLLVIVFFLGSYIVGFLGITHVELEGQVSSLTTSTFFVCTQTIEFYGGQSNQVFCNYAADVVSANRKCRWVSNGMRLQSVNCVE